MANTQAGNVIRVDTSAAFTETRRIRAVRYIGASTSSGTIKGGGTSSGNLLWEETASTNVYTPDVEIYDADGVYVTITGTAVVYLYLE